MPSIPDPSQGVNTPPAITEAAEGGGITLTCECGWLRWYPSKSAASGFGPQHAKSCKGATGKREPAKPKPMRAADWAGREGATWIDKL